MTGKECKYRHFCRRVGYNDATKSYDPFAEHGVCDVDDECVKEPGEWDQREVMNFLKGCQCFSESKRSAILKNHQTQQKFIADNENPPVNCGQQYAACMGVS
eukprot:SAG31_NODE_83_length_27039_cov_14.035746_20_plen_102_part_00